MSILACLTAGAALAFAESIDAPTAQSCESEQDETTLLSLRASRFGPIKYHSGQCPGSPGVYCSGNQCCPGIDATGGKTFACPTADANYQKCELPAPEAVYLYCKSDVVKNCTGCQGEQCNKCKWDGQMDCCLSKACHGCSGEQCTYCRADHQEECCKAEGVPSGHHQCKAPPTDLDKCYDGVAGQCKGCQGEQCSACKWEKTLDCCLDDACKGCSGEQCTHCRNDHKTECCASNNIPSGHPLCKVPTDLDKCYSGVEGQCKGCQGEQCSACRWEKTMDCCLDDACKGCSGEQCTSCRNDHKKECCASNNIPSGYHQCSVSNPGNGTDLDMCYAGVNARCRGCQGEQCSECRWEKKMECCIDDQCKGCSGSQCSYCRLDRKACCASNNIPPKYDQCTVPSMHCYASIKRQCETAEEFCDGENCNYCRWSKSLDCCILDACKGCQGEQCTECRNDHTKECCASEGIPTTYDKCKPPSLDR